MPRITALETALPDHILEQKDVKRFAVGMFGEAFPDIDRLLPVYDNAMIEQRRFCAPISWFETPKTFREKNDYYIEQAVALSKKAIARCLEEGTTTYEEIDYILFVSTTGLSTPSIDARLIEDLPFNKRVKRLPIWGLGCAGGAASLSRAMDLAKGNPSARILVVVVELCGLTFVRNDLSKAALIATSLFGDGCAAALVVGDDVPYGPNGTAGPHLLDSYTRTMPDSLDVMGWDIGEDGFRIVMSRDIPTVVRTFMREGIEEFLAEHNMTTADVAHYVTHPGGAKVIEAYRQALDVPETAFRHTVEVLRDYGNMSACSVLFVLKRFMEEIAGRQEDIAGSEYGLLGALGPGFSAELLLLKWGGGE